MKAIGDLDCQWCAPPPSISVQTGSIAGDHLYPWMQAEPLREAIGGTHRKQVDHLQSLQIHEDCPVTLVLAPGPIIYA